MPFTTRANKTMDDLQNAARTSRRAAGLPPPPEPVSTPKSTVQRKKAVPEQFKNLPKPKLPAAPAAKKQKTNGRKAKAKAPSAQESMSGARPSPSPLQSHGS